MDDIARRPAVTLLHASITNHEPLAQQLQLHPQQQQQRAKGIWSIAEHDRFLDALKAFPLGPWKAITDVVGTRSIRQVQTHAQKYHEKVLRRLNGSSKAKVLRLRQEHRIDHAVLDGQTIIRTPGERRRTARKASAAKLAATSAQSSVASVAESNDAGTTTAERSDSSVGDADIEEEDTNPRAFGADLFRLSMSECDDDEYANCEKDDEDDDDTIENDLPSLSECLDFFIACFSATAQQPHHHAP